MQPPDRYFDNTGRERRPGGRRAHDPDPHAEGRVPSLDAPRRQQPAGQGSAPARRTWRDARVLRRVRLVSSPPPGSSTTTTTSSARPSATSPTTRSSGTSRASWTRSNRCGVALGLDRDNFYLLGQSWGGILAIEYALEHQEHLKGLVISNMMSSGPAYNDYAEWVLMPAMDQGVLAEIKGFEASNAIDDPRYMELLMEHHYVHHILRMPRGRLAGSGEPGLRRHQPGDLRADAGAERARRRRGPARPGTGPTTSPRITVPTLVIGARHDTMDPAFMEMMAASSRTGRYLLLPERQPPRDVRRPGHLFRGPHRLHPDGSRGRPR